MEVKFYPKKGLIGYKLESDYDGYKKLAKNATGKVYSVKATEKGISIFKNGELVAEDLDYIKHQDDKSFFVGFKGDKKFLFDWVNEREMEIVHGHGWGPSFVVAPDGTTYSVKNGVVFAEPRAEKTVISDKGEVSEYFGAHFTYGEDGEINLIDEDGKVMKKAVTTDKNATIGFNSASGESNFISAHYIIKEAGAKKLMRLNGEFFYETDLSHSVSTYGSDQNKCAILVDYDPKTKTSVVNIFEKKNEISKKVEISGYAKYIRTDKETGEYIVERASSEETRFNDRQFVTLSGQDVTQKIQKQIDDEWEYYRRLGEQRSREIRAQKQKEEEREAARDADESARSHETGNILMGASLMGLGMPATGATVIATTMIARHKREQAKRARDEGENSRHSAYESDDPEFGDE